MKFKNRENCGDKNQKNAPLDGEVEGKRYVKKFWCWNFLC